MPGHAWAVPGGVGSAWAHYLHFMINWEPEPERPVWVQVMEIVRERILDGTYPVRTKIPGIARIMQEFGVGNNTARHVIDDLEKQGLVRPVPSLGTFVVPPEERTVGGDGS